MALRDWKVLMALAVPFLIYAAHSLLYRSWLIDDAGITFAYAFNLANGHGLVSQPGMEPVEGFSNPLWTGLISVMYLLGIFETYLTAKLIAALLVAGMMVGTYFVSKAVTNNRSIAGYVGIGACTLASVNPAFVVWSNSGLENPLYAFLVVVCALIAIRLLRVPSESARAPSIVAGLIVGMIALTRPDGIAFALTVSCVLVIRAVRDGLTIWWLARTMMWFSIPLVLLVGAYEAFRLAYFEAPLPNTFYAKHGTSIIRPFQQLFPQYGSGPKLAELFGSAFPYLGVVVQSIAVVFPIIFACTRKGRRHDGLAVIFIFAGTSACIYMALPADWMLEYRFATPFYPLIYILILAFVSNLARAFLRRETKSARNGAFAALIAVVAVSVGTFTHRAMAFARNPTCPLEEIAIRSGVTFNEYRKVLGISNGSLLSPDLGGTLMYSELRVIDLAGLCDKTIAPLINSDAEGLRDYILGTVKPTFIYIHTHWDRQTRFGLDPRFPTDYLQIGERDFVRIDALNVPVGEASKLAAQARDRVSLKKQRLYPR